MEGQTDGAGKRTDGRMDGGTDPCMHGRADVGRTNGRTNGAGKRRNGRMDGDGRTERENGGTVGSMDGLTDGRADGWKDGRTERENGRTLFVFLTFIKNSLFRYKYARIF